ncbi:Txe/YoeB family addiction module toxin [Dyella sp. OK004]|uniref:Txe/YoeB family addiction module toxin n=1 Tax=Dyella sp. OK004 TaxID=1855292 RepID=UPI000B831106|nr:Txe/YoeB family addiction module toxin [Dyella sp. OK004]
MGQGWEDYLYWQANDPKKVEAINDLITDIRRNPWAGLGKPEPLKANWAGWWSRRITIEHRLVYRLFDMDKPGKGQAKPGKITVIQIAQARFHYGKK